MQNQADYSPVCVSVPSPGVGLTLRCDKNQAWDGCAQEGPAQRPAESQKAAQVGGCTPIFMSQDPVSPHPAGATLPFLNKLGGGPAVDSWLRNLLDLLEECFRVLLR